MSDTDFAALIEPVARALWGEPNAGLSTKMSLRWGGQGSRAIFLDGPGNWKNFESGEQGGVIDLVMIETGADRDGALEWLEAEGFIPPRDEAKAPRQRQEATPPSEDGSEPELPSVASPEAKEIAVKGYHYTDEDGNVLYDVIRFQFQKPDGSWVLAKSGNPKKTFRQRRPNGKGGFIWGLGDVGHTLYHRPQLEIGIAEGKTVFLPEGEKDVETLESWGLVATTNSGGAQNWKPEFAEFLRGADVVVLGDDDEPGRKRVEAVAFSLRGIAARIRAVTSWGGPKDVTDWATAGGDAAKLAEIIQNLSDWRPAPPVSVFNATHVADVEERRKHRRHDWLVQDFIENGGICSFSGASQAGKTFAVTELAFCVARGEKFFGRDVKQGLVIYQVGEGELGFEKRLDGYARDRGLVDLKSIPFLYWPRKINLFVDDKDTDAIINEAKAQEAYMDVKLRLFVIDTFNKATRGANEISGQDMGKVIERVERIAAALDCTVVLIDHLNKSGDFRGHGSKTMDVTNTIKVALTDRVDHNGRKIRRMNLDKNKDGENGLAISFVLRQVVVGEDQFGRTETTCVTEAPDGNEDEIVASGRLPPNMAFMLRAIRDTADIEGRAAPAELVQVPPGRNVAPWDAFMTRMRKTWSFTASEQKLRDRELARVVADAGKRLLLAGYIGRDNDRGLIWWTGKEDRPRPIARASEPAKLPERPSPLMTADDMQVPF